MPATVLYEDLLLPEKKLNWSCEAEAPHLKLIYYKISVNEKSTLWIEFGSTPVRLKKLALVYPRIRDYFDKERNIVFRFFEMISEIGMNYIW